MAHVVATRGLSRRFAIVTALDRFSLLIRGQLRLAAERHAARLDTDLAVARARADQFALETSQATHLAYTALPEQLTIRTE